MGTCTRCGSRLVEVDNPMRREVRHPRGVDCPGPLAAAEEEAEAARWAELVAAGVGVAPDHVPELPPFTRAVP